MSTVDQTPRATDRPALGLSRRTALRVAGGGLAVAVAARRYQPATAAPAHAPARVESAPAAPGLTGGWVITYQPGAEAEVGSSRILTSFGADGTVHESLPPAWAGDGGNRSGGVGQGLWTPIDGGAFVYRSLAFRYDEARAYQGETILRVDVTLDAAGQTLSGTFAQRALDAAGVAVGGWDGAVTGVRAELLPVQGVDTDPAGHDLPPQPGRPGEAY